MKIEALIRELKKELAHGHEEILIGTGPKQLYPNAFYDFDLGIDEDGQPLICPTNLGS